MPNVVENKAITVVTESYLDMTVRPRFALDNVSKSKRDNANHKGVDLIA